jgi:ElaB/YqjD/DUF883 family membrane-anchored ribosome-binding protein
MPLPARGSPFHSLGDNTGPRAIADEETKQLLRDILAELKGLLEHLQRHCQDFEAECKAYAQNAELYKQSLQPRPWDIAYRAVIGIGILLLLAYLAIRV